MTRIQASLRQSHGQVERTDVRTRGDARHARCALGGLDAISMNMPAPCTSGIVRVRTNTFRFINDAMGSHASTPSGRGTLYVFPPLS